MEGRAGVTTQKKPMGPPPKESTITTSIIKWLNTLPECYATKNHGGMYGTAGIPDVTCVYKGKAVFFEVKRPGGKGATDLQNATIVKLANAGAHVQVVRSLVDVKACMMTWFGPELGVYKMCNSN
jgi:hypothetical protein